MKLSWCVFNFHCAILFILFDGTLLQEGDGPSLLDDLLLPYKHHHGPTNHIRRIRSIQESKYNFTYEMFPANVTEKLLPVAKTRYFVSDISSGPYQYYTLKAYGHITTVSNPLQTFSVLEPQDIGGCGKNTRETVENSSRQRKCLVSQNGGFFNTTSGSCLGNIISDGRLVQNHGEIKNANFGITENGTIIVGYLSTEDIQNLDFKQLVGGAIWLVRKGTSYVEEAYKCESSEIEETGTLRTFIDVQSARTAIGHDSNGRIVLVNVEGQTRSRGVNLNQFANLLIDEFHLVNAINLDGGGSATLVLNGSLSNYPSDHCKNDPEWRCARAVSTIVCVHDVDCDPDCVHGECEHGRCLCSENFRGDTCDELYCGHHNCSNHGICSPDGCDCNLGWHGRDCNVPCGSGYFGKNCSQECRCQNNGTCNTIDGTCHCLPGFGGALCEKGCELGTYGRNCAYSCHCTDSCYCDAIDGVCDNRTTIQQLEDNSAIHVAQCLMKKEFKKKKKEEKQEDFLAYHWMAILCTTAGALVLSVAFNVYMLLIKFDCIGDYHYRDNSLYDTTKHTTRYVSLQTSIPPEQYNMSEKDAANMQTGGIHLDQGTEMDSLNNKNSSEGIHSSPVHKTRPFSMEGHRKLRTKRKTRMPSLKKFVENFKNSHRTKDGYQKLLVSDATVEYDETSLLSEIR